VLWVTGRENELIIFHYFQTELIKNNSLIKYTSCVLLFIYVNVCLGQSDTIQYGSTMHFPLDFASKSLLIQDLNDFLNLYTKGGSAVQPDLMTMPLTDELNDIKRNETLQNPAFFKAYLENVILLGDSSYFLQFSFLGIKDGTPMLRASFNLIAQRHIDHFIFSSPLQKNIQSWKRENIENITYIFPDSIDQTKASAFARLDSFYNTKINVPGQQTVFIQADNFPDALHLIGVNYKSDYAGYAYNSLSDYSKNKRIVISGRSGKFPNYDPHDSWHEKLRTVMSDSVINRPVDEGCAYLFGGSWGFTWFQVLDSFKLFVNQHPGADWLTLYKDGDKFNMGIYQNGIANVLNALLVQKIQQEKGFPAVMTLLSCGRREKGDANYFKALKKITGITENNFNKEINRLLK
jgi:hypothetical protein